MKILAYTVSHGARRHLPRTVALMRGSAGVWYDWLVCLGAPSPDLKADAERLLNDPRHLGIQYLQVDPQNRGQHYFTRQALALAREHGYGWLLRLDDDVTPKTKEFLKKMVNRLVELHDLAKDEHFRIVAAPKVLGLQHPLSPVGSLNIGQSYGVDLMETVGGACRLHPVELLDGYEPNLYDPVGRGDPEGLALHVNTRNGMIVRFPDIRVVHETTRLEAQDTSEMSHLRKMGKIWPFLENAEI